MPQLVKKRRSGWAVLAAGALVASLLAVGATPAGAATDKADHASKTSACVGDALDDHMFTDVADEHAFKDAINCIAYYGVTNGTGDGSTYSPNEEVTRAQMAVFIARAAETAGVDLGDAMGDEFDDVGGTWAEGRDAINRLASKGVIASGGDFRPDDAITRGEMATFLVGLLAKASSAVTIDSNGAILLGESGSAMAADDHFADARASVPAANDREIAAIYELGITKGASAAAVQDDDNPPLDYNYEPHGTVHRGQMAAFITRALAHTSARPEGVSAQYDGADVVVSVRDENFAPVANVVVDLFRIDAGGVDLAFRSDGSCGEVGQVSQSGTYVCEIDGTDLITGGGGDTNVALGDIDMGGTIVWAWTGDNEDVVNGDTDLYRLDVDESEETSMAERVHVSTDFAGKKAHQGSSVLYTVQLQDAGGDAVTVGADGDDPAQFLVTLSTTAYVRVPVDPEAPDPNVSGFKTILNPQGASVVSTLPLTTDGEGKATFSVSSLPDQAPDTRGDKYSVSIKIQGRPGGNAPAVFHVGDEAATPDGTGLVTVSDGIVFSTEASSRDADDVTLSVKPAAEYVAASARGASNRATVSVSDQYGDPITGARVSLSSDHGITIGGGRALTVGRDGSYTFGYEREGSTSATQTLTASWDHDGDSATDAITSTATVEWAAAATATGTGVIGAVDTEMNTIFAGASGSVVVIRYDSNDRFDINEGSGAAASSYAAFERSVSKGDTLDWNIVGSGSRVTNIFTLAKAS